MRNWLRKMWDRLTGRAEQRAYREAAMTARALSAAEDRLRHAQGTRERVAELMEEIEGLRTRIARPTLPTADTGAVVDPVVTNEIVLMLYKVLANPPASKELPIELQPAFDQLLAAYVAMSGTVKDDHQAQMDAALVTSLPAWCRDKVQASIDVLRADTGGK